MGSIYRTYGSATANPVAPNSTVLASHINTDLDTLFSWANGGVENVNIGASAGIAISKTTLGTFTDWTDFSQTFTGFSANPTYRASRYMQLGKQVTYYYSANADGTSNATTFTMQLPVAPKIPSSGTLYFYGILVNDSTSGGTYLGEGRVTSGTTLNIYRITGTFPTVATGQAFANTGNKGISGGFTLVYEAN